MSDLFNIYEDNLNNVVDRIKKISETFNNLSKEKAESAIQDANNSIKEADRLLKQMDIECSANSTKSSNGLVMKLRNYNNEFDAIKKRFMKCQENYINQKSEDALILGSQENNGMGDTGGQQKHKLIENEQSAYHTLDKLEIAKRGVCEMESITIDVMRNLDDQTNHMHEIGKKVETLHSNLDDSNMLLHRMTNKTRRNKIIIITTAAILIVVAATVLMLKYI